MRYKVACFALFALLATLVAVMPVEAGEAGTWTGEIVDVACYVPSGAHGADHAGCAKKCVKAGQPMGLLTAEGSLVLLAADHGDGAPFEALKDLAGEQAEVQGELSEKDGMKVITVTGSKAAS